MPSTPDMPSDTLAEPRPPSRDGLVAAILAFIGGSDFLTAEAIRFVLEREIDAAGPAALVALKARLGADDGSAYYSSDPLARRIHHLLADRFLEGVSTDDRPRASRDAGRRTRGPVRQPSLLRRRQRRRRAAAARGRGGDRRPG